MIDLCARQVEEVAVKKVLTILGTLVVLTGFMAPTRAGDFSIFGSWWDATDVDNVGGGGLGFGWPVGKVLDFSARASYYEELKGDTIDLITEGNTPFEPGVKVLPVELGLRFNFSRENAMWHPWLGAGGTYFALDTDSGNIDDEAGYYGTFGMLVGDGEGIDFYGDFTYRFVEATINDLDLNSDNIDSSVDLNLDGPVANVGIAWRW